MRFVLELFVIAGMMVSVYFASKGICSLWLKRRDQKRNQEEQMWKDVREALNVNSKHRLEDLFIIYNKKLPKEIKPMLQSRIDDLIIAESEENYIKDLNK